MDEPAIIDYADAPPPDPVIWEDRGDGYKPPTRLLEECLAGLAVEPPLIAGRPPLVFIGKETLSQLREAARVDIRREHGGILYGLPFEDPCGRFFVFVVSFIPAPFTLGSSTHLRFDNRTWQEIWNKSPHPNDQVLVGWYHTHPGLGVFMSGTDQRTHTLYFPQPWQVALVLDPVSDKLDFFYGPSGRRLEDVRTFLGECPPSPGPRVGAIGLSDSNDAIAHPPGVINHTPNRQGSF